ncbi:hypothetical protein GCM10027048_13900 [Hymenobacter coalescens]
MGDGVHLVLVPPAAQNGAGAAVIDYTFRRPAAKAGLATAPGGESDEATSPKCPPPAVEFLAACPNVSCAESSVRTNGRVKVEPAAGS